MRRTTFALLAVLSVLALAAGTATASPGAPVAQDSDRDPGGDAGPPGFVGDLLPDVVPDFVSDLLGSLPVPEFLAGLFGG